MKAHKPLLRKSTTLFEWTPERVGLLSKQEITQLRTNAAALANDGVVALCDAALTGKPKPKSKPKVAKAKAV
jgi:hypothetical protein